MNGLLKLAPMLLLFRLRSTMAPPRALTPDLVQRQDEFIPPGPADPHIRRRR